MLIYEIDGLPTPWTPARVTRHGHAYNPKNKEKEYAIWQIKSQHNRISAITAPIILHLSFHMPIPSGTSKVRRLQMLNGKIHHIKRPDTSNLIKFAEDCLKTIVIEDDSQVIRIVAEKIFGEKPKTVIKIECV